MIPASVTERGVAKHSWWEDWRGEYCAIIASGPSAKKADLGALAGKVRVIAIKECWELLPDCDVVYGCDAPFWRTKLGLQSFKGVKVAYAKALSARFPDIRLIDIDMKRDRILTETPGMLGCGGNSGFQALNLAVQFGVKGILLIGYDMHDRSGVHWFGRAQGQGRSNPLEHNFKRWRVAFAQSADDLKQLGVDVVNASPQSDLTCFRKASIADTMREWGL